MTVSTVPPPTFTDTVDQRFFVEALGGSKNPQSYLDRFPDSVYSKGIDTSLVHFLYTLLGPVGAGFLREEYLQARLIIEEAGLSTADLDSLYTTPFAFARLATETYDIDAAAVLLPWDQRAKILASDAAFRNRAIDFLKGIRAGGTVQGITLAAKSGLNHPVEVIENYKALYDSYADVPLGIPYQGTTTSLNEIIVIPRNDIPRSAQQSISLSGTPTAGWFSLTYPANQPANFLRVGVRDGVYTDDVLQVPDAFAIPPGVLVTIGRVTPTFDPTTGFTSYPFTSGHPTIYAMAGNPVDATHIKLVHPPGDASVNQPYPMTVAPSDSTHIYYAYAGLAQTVRLPYNATFDLVQQALQALPTIGRNNVLVSGGPLPDTAIVVNFTQGLADTDIPTLQVNFGASDPIAGIGSGGLPLQPTLSGPNPIIANVSTDIVGVGSDGQNVIIPPRDLHAMEVAVDQLRPVTSFVTTTAGKSLTRRQPTNAIFAGSAYTEVLRYTTGQAGVPWPPPDARLNWIEAGQEHEAPTPASALTNHYQNFHDVSSIIAYTEGALADTYYQDPTGGPSEPIDARYFDTQIGSFNQAQQALFPFLQSFQDPSVQFSPQFALAAPDRPIVTHVLGDPNNTGVVNGRYPASYAGLPGVAPPRVTTAGRFWASQERIAGSDYLEIDLGTVQAVNYIYFEATRKPYLIFAAYDTFDQTPSRHFVAATIAPATQGASTTNLVYDAGSTNPWVPVELHVTNSLNSMIYTRFIRLAFQRSANGAPFQPQPDRSLPYSIEIRNLRIGRNVVSGGNSADGQVGHTTALAIANDGAPIARFTFMEI